MGSAPESARVARSAIIETVLRPSVAAFGQTRSASGYDRLLEPSTTDQDAIFVANHHSHLDTSLLLTSIPNPWRHRLVVGAASEVFFNTRFKAMLSALSIGAFPIDRSTMGRAAADQAAELIDDGNSLLIFPEGGRSKDGWGQPFRGGAAYLALRCDVPVVPIYLAGTAKVWRKGQRLPRPARTAVLFGDPMWATEGENTRRFNARIEAAVSSLGDEMATDWWQARLRHYRKDTPSLEGPQASSWRRAWALGATTKRRSRNSSWPN